MKINASITIASGRNTSAVDLETEPDYRKGQWVVEQDGYRAEADSLHKAIILWFSARLGWPIESDGGRSHFNAPGQVPDPEEFPVEFHGWRIEERASYFWALHPVGPEFRTLETPKRSRDDRQRAYTALLEGIRKAEGDP